MKKRIPAPIDEKNVVSDWIYEDLGDLGRASNARVGRCNKAAFYMDGELWEARWLEGYNSVRIDAMSRMIGAQATDKFVAKIRGLLKDLEGIVAEVSACENSNETFTINISFFYEQED